MKVRKYLRVPVPIPVRIKVLDRHDEFTPATLDDISWGGAFVVMDPPAEVNQRMVIEFVLPEESVTLELWGRVVRSRPTVDGLHGGVGIEFDPLDEDSRSLIQKMITDEIRGLMQSAL